MVAFNFKPAFAPKIKARTKLQTIRQSQRCKAGDPMQLYTGLRTKAAKKIMPDVKCEVVYPLRIHADKVVFQAGQCHTLRAPADLERFANDDGFETWQDLVDFFHDHYALPFNGYLHRWLP